jgi:hypothetical protein
MTHTINAITIKTRKKAHHIPALNIPDTTLHPGNILMATASTENKDIFFIQGVYLVSKISCHIILRHGILDGRIKANAMSRKTNPIKKEKEVEQNPDEHIDQDYPGFLHPPSHKKNISPTKPAEKKSAGLTKKRSRKTYG